MLVLSRKSGETIEIDGGITVQVISVSGNQVKIGIVAPKTVRVLRGELTASSKRKPRSPLRLPHVDHCPVSQQRLLQAGPPC